MMNFPDNDNIWRGFLEEKPEAAYFGYQGQWNTPDMKRYFQRQFSNIQNQYMGRLGQQIYGGGAPTLQFMDFLRQFPWQQQFASLPPGERGMEVGRFSPFTQWVSRLR